jgi:metal-dependent amidase/aminoacylase/carboxypeptidase family protein
LKTATIGYFEAISARNRLPIAYFGFKDYITVDQNLEIRIKEKSIIADAYLSAEKHNRLDDVLSAIKADIKKSKYAQDLLNISINKEAALVINDPHFTDLTISALREVYGKEQILPLFGAIPDGRSDDFAFLQKKIPGVYFLLGASDFKKGIISMPHSPNFDVDENTIKTGVQSFSSLILDRLK